MRWTKFLMTSVAAATLAGAAHAQTAPATDAPVETQSPPEGESRDGAVTVDELVVTAQKREERLQDVPLTVSVVSGEQLERQNITNTAELQNASPELNYTSGPTAGYSIRGSGTATFARSAENNVSIVVDGVVQGQLQPPVNSLFDVERVEILSGPQGMLFGKNASAGVVNIVTRAPELNDTALRFFTALGTDGYQVYQGVANQPLSETAALRLNLFSNSMGGLFTNRFNGQDVGAFTNYGGRARILWDVTPALRLNFIADIEQQNGGNSAWQARSVSGVIATRLAACGVRPGPENTDLCVDGPLSRVSSTYGLTVQADYELGDYTLTSITADRQYVRAVDTDSDAQPINGLNTNKATDFNNQFSQELRITSPDNRRLEYVTGLYYYNYNYKTFVDQAGTLGALPFAVGRASAQKINQYSYAVFGQGTFALTEQINLILGGRFTRDFLSASTVNLPESLNGRRFAGFTPAVGSATDKLIEDDFSYRVGVQYLPTPDATFFLTYTEGYKGPALNNLVPGRVGPRVIDAETPKNLEAGVKASLFDRRMLVDLTLFNTVTEDFQAQTAQIVNGVTAFVFDNADELRARGFQFNAYAQATEELSFTAGVLYNDATYGDFVVQCNLPFIEGCSLVGGQQVINAKGRQLAGAPKWKIVGSVNYDFTLPNGLGAFVQTSAAYRSEAFTSPTPDPNLVIDGYTRVDARLGVRSADERWTLALFAKNLFDERSAAFIFRDPLSPVNNYQQAFGTDAFRIVGVSLDVNY